MKTKRTIILIFTLVFTLLFTSIALAEPMQKKAEEKEASQTFLSAADVTEVSGVLNDVLSSELNIVKTGKIKDYGNVINEKKLLQMIQKEGEYKQNWYDEIGFKIPDYNSSVKINNGTQLSDNKYELDVTFQAELMLNEDSQIQSKMSDDYVCEIENKSGQWVINKLINKVDYQDIVIQTSISESNSVTNADILANNDKILDTKLKDLETRSNNLDEKVKSYKGLMKQTENTLLDGSEKATAAYSGINRTAVANYATTYAMNHNPNYTYISGADCTNFASQAINAGGVPQNSSSWAPYNAAWVNVESFKTYMVNNGYASVFSITSANGMMDGISRGDVLQFRHAYWIYYTHSAIATYCSDTYGWLLSAHTSDRLNYPMSMYFGDFSYGRDVHFW